MHKSGKLRKGEKVFTAEQVRNAIVDATDDYESEFYNEIDGNEEWELPLINATAKGVDSKGGEGQGDYACVIFKIGDQYFKKDGEYSSWDGMSWEYGDLYEVEPYQELVTRYRKK